MDGWLRTGDIGFLSADGFLTLTDRSKDVIISGGTNIYPREVEEVIARHPDVFEVAVVGAPHPEWGEEVVAFVVLRAGAAHVDATVLEAWCRAEMASFKSAALCVPRRAAQEQLRQDPEDRTAEPCQAAGRHPGLDRPVGHI